MSTTRSATKSYSTHLPFELIEKIIELTWFFSLSTNARIEIMTNFPLVSSDFYASFRRISLTDIIVPHPNYLKRLQSIVNADVHSSAFQPKHVYDEMFSINKSCRSLTFTYDLGDILRTMNAPWCEFDDNCLAGRINNGHQAVLDSTYELSSILDKHLPNLDTIHLQFIDLDVYRLVEFISAIKFPSQVKHLEVTTFDLVDDPEYTPYSIARRVRCKMCARTDAVRSWGSWKADLKHLKQLTIAGSPNDVSHIGDYVVPTKGSGALEKLNLVYGGKGSAVQREIIKRLYARV